MLRIRTAKSSRLAKSNVDWAFAEALAHWEASRVSAILATTPLLCIAAAWVVHALWPQWLAPERIAPIGWAGAALVVAGSAAVSLLNARR